MEGEERGGRFLGSHPGFVLRETVPIVALKYRATVNSRCDVTARRCDMYVRTYNVEIIAAQEK